MVNSIARNFISAVFLFVFSPIAFSQFSLSIGTATWQEKIPVVYNGVELRAKTSFTALAVGMGYVWKSSDRWKIDLGVSLLAGLADIQKLENAISPRRNTSSVWLAIRNLFKVSEAVQIGPNLTGNLRKMDSLDAALNAGLFLDLDYLFSENSTLSQSIGTMSDSKELAYSIKMTRTF